MGLAPGLKGAHRTGRVFTGDASGELLFGALERFGFCTGENGNHADDGLELVDVMITNAVRCVPPQNKPTAAEINACRPFLRSRIEGLEHLKVIFVLGRIAHESTVKALGLSLKDHPFGHGVTSGIMHKGRALALLSSFHCSRYNVNTRRLTPEMFDAVVKRATELMNAAS